VCHFKFNLPEIDIMSTQELSIGEMPPEDSAFYAEFGVSAALALAIVLLV
jgi:hypothetical protein